MTLLHRSVAVMLLLSATASDITDAPTADTYLSDEFFPGLHILEWINGGSDLQIFPRGQRPQAGKQSLVAKGAKDWGTMLQARQALESVLEIPEPEPLQTPWALFDTQGHRLKDMPALSQASVAFLVELGQMIWPPVRVGFEHKVDGVFSDKPAILRTLALRPVIFEVTNFFSHSETEQIMDIGKKQGLTTSQGVMQSGDLQKGTKHSDFRTSRQAWLHNGMHPLINKLDERVAHLTRIPSSHNEAAQLLRYDGGEYYHGHMDWAELELVDDQKQLWESHHMGWQDRLGNVFWYLNDVEKDGHTIFPKAWQPICYPETMGGPGTRHCPGAQDPVMSSCEDGLKVYPKRGSVILWYNFHPNGRGDRNSLHAGCPPGENITKWSANKWFSIKPLNSPGRWVEDHPAIKRFGFRGKSSKVRDPNVCQVVFANEVAEAIDLMWEGGSGYTKLASIPAGQSTSQNSYKGHRFSLWAGSRKSNVVTCSGDAHRFVLTADFTLKESTRDGEEL